jgi:hypothetical protein
MVRVYGPGGSFRYDVIRPVLQIKKIDGVSDQWGASITMTDVMESGGYLLFFRTGSDQMRSRSNITYYTTIRKFV